MGLLTVFRLLTMIGGGETVFQTAGGPSAGVDSNV
jgi:hypothetical protein